MRLVFYGIARVYDLKHALPFPVKVFELEIWLRISVSSLRARAAAERFHNLEPLKQSFSTSYLKNLLIHQANNFFLFRGL